MFLTYLFNNPQFYVYWIVIIVFSICVHEFSHALVAYWQGDDTAKQQGYFTINPMVQMGKISLLCVLIFGLCWGACPVDPTKMKHKYSDALVSFAGPFSNFVLSAIFTLFALLTYKYYNTSILANNISRFFEIAAYVNATLGVFNLIPLPPLDGSKIMTYIIPKVENFYVKIGGNGFVFLFLALTIFPKLNDILWGSGTFFVKSMAMFYSLIYYLFKGIISAIA